MSSDDEKKKYWCDQIKSMLGPCMITFAIPLMVPGFTITFVAFADEDAFPKYGALHVVGILILGIAVILIMVGCFLRFYWKPFIGPDIEMHLSPNGSVRSMHADRVNSRNLKVEKAVKETSPKHVQTVRRNSLESERARMDNIPIISKKKEIKSESETEGTGSESELKKSLTGNNERKLGILASPRSRHLMPVNSELLEERDQNYPSQNDFQETESYEALQDWRKKKRRAKKKLKQTEKLTEDDSNIDKSRTEPENLSDQQHCQTTVEKKHRRKKEKRKKVLNALRQEQQTRTGEDNTEFLSTVCESKVPELDIFNSKNENQDSDHSSVSIGSADSVLAQYTSRSIKNQNE